jgi:predicted RNA-binding protein with TRAM domain
MNMRNSGGFDRGSPRRSFAPVKIGDELDVHIEAVGEKGDGIAKKNGFVLFVPNVNEGDNVRIRVTKVLRRVGFADVIGEATEKPEKKEARKEEKIEEEHQEEKVEEEEKESMESEEDTEDFGEDLEEEKK